MILREAKQAAVPIPVEPGDAKHSNSSKDAQVPAIPTIQCPLTVIHVRYRLDGTGWSAFEWQR